MSELHRSDLYWGIWIFVLFLVPELLAACGAIPMYTLSHTSWANENTYPVLRTLIAGFLMGLAVHIRFGTRFGPAEAGGVIIALVIHLFWGLI